MDLGAYFEGSDGSRRIFESLYAATAGLDPLTLRVTKSQVAFVRNRVFAWA